MYKRKSFTRYPRSSSLKSRTYGQYKSAKKVNDSLTFVVTTTESFYTLYDPITESGTAAINVWEVLSKNSQFYSLKNMYDQVRIDGIRCNINLSTAQVEVGPGTNNANALQVWTAWDRTGLSEDEIEWYSNMKTNPPTVLADRNTGTIEGYRTVIGSKITNKTGAEKSPLNIYQNWRRYTQLYPTLIQEKGQYVQTGDIYTFNEYRQRNQESIKIVDRYTGLRMSELTSSTNPCTIIESSNCRFKPILLVGVFSTEINDGNTTNYGAVKNPVIFTAEFKITLTFRNLKGATNIVPGNVNGQAAPNKVVAKIKRQMDTDSVTIQGQTISIDFGNFLTNPDIVYNENRVNYATNIELQLEDPNMELTPTSTDGVIQTNNTQNGQGSFDPAQLITWDRFTSTPENTTVENPYRLPMKYGENLIVFETTDQDNPNEGADGHAVTVIQNNIPGETGQVSAYAKIMKNVKYYVQSRLSNPERLYNDLFWLNNKRLQMTKICGLAKMLSSGMIAAAAAKHEQMGVSQYLDVYNNGTLLLYPAGENGEDPYEEVNTVTIDGTTFRDDLNGNIYTNDLISFELPNSSDNMEF